MFEIIECNHHPGLRLTYQSNKISTDDQAWEVSLLKWRLILRLCSQGILVDDGGRQTCGLCSCYFYGHADECEDCPIKLAGHPACYETPYRDYLAAVEKGDLALAKQAAANEIEFLRSFQMGLDYSYLLYFKREYLWPALLGVADIAWEHDPPSRIIFPDHLLPIPLGTWGLKEKDYRYDEAEFDFSTVINFEPDEAILEYLHERGDDDIDRGSPDPNKKHQVGIGMIYLTIYQEIPDQPASTWYCLNLVPPAQT